MQLRSGTLIDLGPEHNWCDKRCERCPLADRCRVAIESNQWRERVIARGEDPDHPEVLATELSRTFKQTLVILAADAVKWGIDLDDLEPLPPPNRVQQLLEDRAHAFVMRAHDLLRDADSDTAFTARSIGAKVARLATSVIESWELDELGHDGAATLLVIEQLVAAVDRGIDGLVQPDEHALASCRRARAELLAALRPFYASADDAVREAIAALTAAGRAPSPFCVVRRGKLGR